MNYFSNGGEYVKENHSVTFLGWSINTNYSLNKLIINSSFSAHAINRFQIKSTDLISNQGIPYFGHYMDNYQKGLVLGLSTGGMYFFSI